MQKQELVAQIEAYLNRTLPPEELRAWEQRLVDEPELRRAVELHRSLHQDYDAGRLRLRANLRNIMEEPLPPAPPVSSGRALRWATGVGILGLALLLGWIFWPKQPAAPALPETPAPALPATPSEPVPQKEAPPIAQVDPARFAPNPSLEAFVKSSVRSESIEVTLSRPAQGLRLIPDEKGNVTVPFEGDLKWSGDLQPGGFSLLFFNNKNANQALLEVPIGLPADAKDHLKIAFRQRLKFPPGLYYFTLEETEKGEILYAGKLLIGQ